MTECAKTLGGCPDRGRLKAAYEALRPGYEAALQSVYKKVRALLEKHGYTPTIKYRVKRFEAYFKKLQRNKGRSGKEEQSAITDLLGLRIICPFLEDLEQVEGLLAGHFEVIETVRKGADHSFREFGYDSVHLLVRLQSGLLPSDLPGSRAVCEIQLRTILQEAWAEVEHELIYKSDIALPNDSIRRKLASLNATLTLSDLIFQEIRDYQKEIRHKGRKRRQSLEERWDASRIMIAQLPALETAVDEGPGLEVLASCASDLERSMLEALEAHSSNDFARAIRLYDRILEMELVDPIRSLVYNHRGMAFFSLSDPQRAVEDFSQAIAFDPENVRAHTNRGLSYRVLKEFDLSLADYDTALSIDPSRMDGYWGRAQTYFEMKLLTQALADCEKVLSQQGDFAPAAELSKIIHRMLF